MKFKKGDTVQVISGKDKGKQGEITAVLPKENKVIVAGINIAKRHMKATKANQKAVQPSASRNLTTCASRWKTPRSSARNTSTAPTKPA